MGTRSLSKHILVLNAMPVGTEGAGGFRGRKQKRTTVTVLHTL